MLTDATADICESNVYSPPPTRRPFDASTHTAAAIGARPEFCRTATPLDEPCVQISPSEAVSRRGMSWPGIAAEVVQTNQRGRIHFRFRAPVHMLVIYERGVRQAGGTFVEGLPPSTLRDCGRKLVFVPAGHEYHDWHEPRTLPRMAFFYFNPAQLGSIPELDTASTSFPPRLFFEDDAVFETALKLRTLIDDGGLDPVYIQALGIVLARELVRRNTHRRCAVADAYGGLVAWQRRKVVEYIEEHLAEPILLTTLAVLVRLSPSYFCRVFRLSFGMPPQRYHATQRIERAKMLLTQPSMSVTDIGLSVGYSETSAFSTAFRRVTGLSPSAYRRTLL
jgi:AraC family transcriptional regulator